MDWFERMTGMGIWTSKHRKRTNRRTYSVLVLLIKYNFVVNTDVKIKQASNRAHQQTLRKDRRKTGDNSVHPGYSAMGNGGKRLSVVTIIVTKTVCSVFEITSNAF